MYIFSLGLNTPYNKNMDEKSLNGVEESYAYTFSGKLAFRISNARA